MTAPDNLVEAVAKAIRKKRGDCGDHRPHRDDVLAKAAILATLEACEPTPEMIEAVCQARNMVDGTHWTDGTTEGVQAIERMLAERSCVAMLTTLLASMKDESHG